ncbi:sensor histidine kinase [Aureispira anguillae]|uniref:Histidine kinase n=1 Tax=Aureispira anguillae TaxID=2864201 RepID=A0A915YCS3_9BACT|nr:histidine kinase [Aureispira anguillae]BDS10694.1 histidine kinase [Aureispira anguillae]
MTWSLKYIRLKALILFCGLLLACIAYSQEPSYENYGREELSGLTIYDQLMSSDEIMYIATSDGVFAYNSIKFQEFKVPKGVKGKSFFDLKENDKNQIFCSNLNGQFFKINGDSLQLFHELSDTMVASFNHYEVVKEGMIINSYPPILVDWEGTVVSKLKSYFFSHLSNDFISRETIGNCDSIEFKVYSNKKYNDPALYSTTIPHQECLIGFFYHAECLYLSNKCLGNICKLNIRTNEFTTFFNAPSFGQGILLDNQQYWAKSSLNGVFEFDINDTTQYQHYYKDFYISPQENSLHGIFLGSDGNGIYQVKNKFLHTFPELNSHYNFRGIIKGPNNRYVIYTRDEVFLLSEKFLLHKIFKSKDLISHVLYAKHSGKLLISSSNKLHIYTAISDTSVLLSKSIHSPNIKSLFEIDYDTFIFSGSGEIGKLNINDDISDKNYLKRVRASCCLKHNDCLYFGTYHGLLEYTEGKNKPNVIKYNGNNIFATKLFTFQNRIIIYSKEYGILQLYKGEVAPMKEIGIESEKIQDIYFNAPYLSITTKKMLVIHDLRLNKQVKFAESNGLNSLNIRSILIDNKILYLVTDKGLQRIPLSKLTLNDSIPHIRINNIFLNDSLISRRNNQFKYWQNKLSFEIVGNAYGKQKNTFYKYKLEGLSSKWYTKKYYDNVIKYQSLPPGKYRLRIIIVYKDREGKEIHYAFYISPPFWQAWWFYVLIVIIAMLTALLIYRVYSLRKIQKIELDNQINKLKLQAIQSQMNPHFIFNAINAIQESVLYDKRKKTYQHINKFSKLVRLTLNFSNEELISLQEELELLELYLELEKIRFPEDFEFEINIQANIDLQIPPMLIQPLVENAILHGLFHKKGVKQLKIKIEEKEQLLITVEDNGVGRKASTVINQRRKKAFEKSFATNAVEDRLMLLKQNYDENMIGVEYIDLFDNKKIPSGTLVLLRLPLIQDF